MITDSLGKMSIFNSKNMQAAINQGEVAYLKLGEGSPLVLIQGFGNHYRDWNSEFIDELSKHFELYLVNNRGVGHSFSTSQDHTIAGIAGDIAQFVRQLPRSSIILGHSMGGYLAQEVAVAASGGIDGLILMSTRMGGRFKTMADPDTLEEITRHYPSRWEETEAIMKYLAPPELHGKLRAHFRALEELQNESDIEISSESRKLHNDARVKWLAGFGEDNMRYRNFDFPTLILAGNEDKIIPIENSFELSKEIRNSWLVRFPDGGHDLHHQFPCKMARLISEFSRYCRIPSENQTKVKFNLT